jgi:hypothetical protein
MWLPKEEEEEESFWNITLRGPIISNAVQSDVDGLMWRHVYGLDSWWFTNIWFQT